MNATSFEYGYTNGLYESARFVQLEAYPRAQGMHDFGVSPDHVSHAQQNHERYSLGRVLI